MNLREIELFGTLMRVGTATETARLLGISQPGVSAQLKRLEGRLGVSLFHRTGNRLEATREANELFALAVPIFRTHAQIRAKADEMRALGSRPVSISVTPTLVEGFLGRFLVRAGYQNWRKRIVLRVHQPEEDLRRGDAEIGLQMAVPPMAEFQSHTVGKSKLIAVMRSNHALAGKSAVTCGEIALHPLVCYSSDYSPMGATIKEAFEAKHLQYDPVCLVPFCTNVCAMVRSCGGVGIVDEITAQSYAMQDLIAKPITDMPDVSIIAFHRRNEPLSAPVQELLAHFQAKGAKGRR